MVDIQDLFEKCTVSEAEDKITARTIYNYMISPFMVHCDRFVPEEKKDPMTEYMQLLFEQGNAHETRVIETNYPGTKKVKFETQEEGFKTLLEGMEKGVDAICGVPALYLPEDLAGVFDVLERKDTAPSVFGDYHYVVKEIKLARRIQLHHVMQVAFYNYMLGKIQGYTPPDFFVINRDNHERKLGYNENELFTILEDIREIQNGKKDVTPTYGACHWPWETYNNEEAERRGDVSLVSGVGQSFKRKLVDAGICTVGDLAHVDIDDLTSIKGIGKKTGEKFLNGSRALKAGAPICIGRSKFPERSTEIFLDLEGTGEQAEDMELEAIDYLIGILIRKDGNTQYLPFTAHGLDKEGEMFEEFTTWLLEQDDFIIYHWHHYEKTHLKRLSDRHGLSDELKNLLFDNMRDLYKDAVSCFAFPTYGNGLKEIAKFMGYGWRHKDVNAMESIAIYFQYVKDPENNAKQLQKVIDYNEDDCQATRVVKDWLVENLK